MMKSSGLTYGYYLTRIQGNTNNKSISISTANLELTYSDNSDIITGTNIVPGTKLGTKIFTVTNSGDNNIDSYSLRLVNVINTFTRLDDIKYTVTCSSSVTGKTCNGVSESTFPNENSYIIENQINKNEVQTYVIEVEYKEMNVDQSVDMNKTLKCSNEEDSVSDYIGTITADEVAYVGGMIKTANKLYYLYNNAHDYYWSLSYSYFYGSDFSRNGAFYVYSNGSLNYNCISREDTCNLGAVRHAVILATGTQITGGDGTIGNPYKILED